jgi:hypothetical protein
MLQFLIPALAKLWDSFKAKNPAIAAIIALVLGTVIYFAEQNTVLGVIPVSESLANIIQTVSTFWLALNGSRTFNYVPK